MKWLGSVFVLFVSLFSSPFLAAASEKKNDAEKQATRQQMRGVSFTPQQLTSCGGCGSSCGDCQGCGQNGAGCQDCIDGGVCGEYAPDHGPGLGPDPSLNNLNGETA
jgi:hypothetical protein